MDTVKSGPTSHHFLINILSLLIYRNTLLLNTIIQKFGPARFLFFFFLEEINNFIQQGQ